LRFAHTLLSIIVLFTPIPLLSNRSNANPLSDRNLLAFLILSYIELFAKIVL
jgi:hypothetical protein